MTQRTHNQYQQKLFEQFILESGIPNRFKSALAIPKEFQSQIKSKNILEDSFYFHGEAGIGKSHLVCAIIYQKLRDQVYNSFNPERKDIHLSQQYKTLQNQNPNCIYLSTPYLLMKIRDTYNNDKQTEKELLDDLSSIPHLYLDDFGVEKVTDWTLQTMYLILNARYERDLKTTFTSNNSIADIEDTYGERIASRIIGMTDEVVLLKGKDRRLK